MPEIIENPDRNTPLEAGEQHLLSVLREAPLDGWTVYVQPHLNGERPDFVLTHPEKGILVIEVKDYNFATGRYGKGAWFLGDNGHWVKKSNPVDQVQKYYRNILTLYNQEFAALEQKHGRHLWNLVETALYFHHGSASQAMEYCEGVRNLNHVVFLDRQNLQHILKGDFERSPLRSLRRAPSVHLGPILKDLESWLRPTAYASERRAPIRLTAEQNHNAQPAPGIHRRLRGVAGAGKTVVLATRAARLLQQGQRVLVLTYNITLRHPIRDLIRQQYEGLDAWPIINQLVIQHYHGLLKWLADLHNIDLTSIPENASDDEVSHILEERWPDEVLQGLVFAELHPDCQFDGVIIDEGQDFSREWLLPILQLLTERDELLIAYDTAQNLYDRELQWIETDTRGLGFRGPPATLKTTHRLPHVMVEIANGFLRTYIDPEAETTNTVPRDFYKHFLFWQNIKETEKDRFPVLVDVALTSLRQRFSAHHNDICVLTESAGTAIPIIEALEEKNFRTSHVFDLSGERNHKARRQEKWRFQPTSGMVKVCTIHSFKGWEAPHLILFIEDKPHTPTTVRAAEIYTALTRVKKPADGSSASLLCYNLDPRFNAFIEPVNRVHVSQQGNYVPKRG